MPNTFVELASAIGRLNLAQGFSLSRSGLQAAGGSLAYQGLTSGNWLMAGLGAVVWAVPTVWGLVSHTNSAKIAAVAAMPGPEKVLAFTGVPDAVKLQAVEAMPQVRKILVASYATNGVADAAEDPARPKVQTA